MRRTKKVLVEDSKAHHETLKTASFASKTDME